MLTVWCSPELCLNCLLFDVITVVVSSQVLPRCMECIHSLAMRILSVCLFSLSVKHVICDKTKEWCVRIFMLYERPLSLVFGEEEWLVVATPSTWNFGLTGPHWQCYFSCSFSVSVKVFDYTIFQLLLSFSYYFSVSISVTIMIFQFQLLT